VIDGGVKYPRFGQNVIKTDEVLPAAIAGCVSMATTIAAAAAAAVRI